MVVGIWVGVGVQMVVVVAMTVRHRVHMVDV